MKRGYTKEDEILELVRSFEEATISRDDWRHREHLVVALYYLTRHDLETATGRMRDGIFNLLRKAFNVDLAKEMPYHETLTVFWMRSVADFSARMDGIPLHDKANSLIDEFDKDYTLYVVLDSILGIDNLFTPLRFEIFQP